MDSIAFIHLSKSIERITYQAIAQRVVDMMDNRDQQLANRIANAVGKMLGLEPR